jgi:hypothetical protein
VGLFRMARQNLLGWRASALRRSFRARSAAAAGSGRPSAVQHHGVKWAVRKCGSTGLGCSPDAGHDPDHNTSFWAILLETWTLLVLHNFSPG